MNKSMKMGFKRMLLGKEKEGNTRSLGFTVSFLLGCLWCFETGIGTLGWGVYIRENGFFFFLFFWRMWMGIKKFVIVEMVLVSCSHKIIYSLLALNSLYSAIFSYPVSLPAVH